MNMKIVRYLLTFLLLAGSFSSITNCSDDNYTTINDGLVRDFGSPAVDGCGWVIIIDDN